MPFLAHQFDWCINTVANYWNRNKCCETLLYQSIRPLHWKTSQITDCPKLPSFILNKQWVLYNFHPESIISKYDQFVTFPGECPKFGNRYSMITCPTLNLSNINEPIDGGSRKVNRKDINWDVCSLGYTWVHSFWKWVQKHLYYFKIKKLRKFSEKLDVSITCLTCFLDLESRSIFSC